VSPSLQVITSKQRPRKHCMRGSNGKDYMFLLKVAAISVTLLYVVLVNLFVCKTLPKSCGYWKFLLRKKEAIFKDVFYMFKDLMVL
jgi:hypothetical protein